MYVLRNLYNDLQDIDLFGPIIGNNVFIGVNNISKVNIQIATPQAGSAYSNTQ